MGFINLISIDDYIKESEKNIYEKYGIKKEELQTMQDDDFKKLIKKIIENCIDVEYCKDFQSDWWIEKTHKRIKIAYEGSKKEHTKEIAKQYKIKKAEGNEKIFLNEMKNNISKVIVSSYAFSYFDIWCDLYLLLKYTKVKDKMYDAYNNSSHFTSIDENDLPISTHRTDSQFPYFGRELQRNLYKENINIFSELYGKGEDITRYGFGVTHSIVERVEQSIYIKEQENNIEELLLIDTILGVTLTNILFWYNKKAPKEKWDDIMEIAKKLACIKSTVGRNLVGEMIGIYLSATEFDNHVINELNLFLSKNVSSFNQCFQDIECVHFISDFDEVEELLLFLEERLLKSGYLICDGKTVRCRFYKIKKIKKELCDKKRIKVSKIKINKYELYACIHRAVIQGIVEINRGSAKK